MHDAGVITPMRALWRPGWYALDQSITVGDRTEYSFRTPTPAEAREAGYDIQFYNWIPYRREFEIRECSIRAIRHAELGLVRAIEVKMDYRIELADGRGLTVDAEGETGGPPGEIYNVSDGLERPEEWVFEVDIEVGPPIGDHRWLERSVERSP